MSNGTTIEWTQGPDGAKGATWNPLIGCTRVSAGCDRCYAIGVAHRFSSSTEAFAGTTERRDDRTDWTGRVNLLGADRLAEPLRWIKPRRIFVNSMSDLFHADVPDEFIARVFAVMAVTPRHTYQLLTKRHARMRSLLSDEGFVAEVAHEIAGGNVLDGRPETPIEPGIPWWPLRNVHLGVSVEDQRWADIRIPPLLATPAAVRWISAEPLLGPLNLFGVPDGECDSAGPGVTHEGRAQRTDYGTGVEYNCEHQAGLDWVVCGGESGPGCRPMHPDWIRDIRDQCAAVDVPFLFKQHGGWQPITNLREWVAGARWVLPDGTFEPGSPGAVRFPDGGRREDGAQLMQLRSKKAAGRLLDGREHLDHP